MHPAIARLISKAFYRGDLKSHESTETRFADVNCPVTIGTYAPPRPITFIDMPYVQTKIGLKSAEEPPRWHNPHEVDAVVRVLKFIERKPGTATAPRLAVLSPYREQLKRLRRKIDENISAFPNLLSFEPAVGPSTFCGTVDSFQGNEADVVVISLVRNNHHSGARSALGFLSDPKRMNVLLSRAQWRLVLVGSLDFLRSVLVANSNNTTGADISFLRLLLDALDDEVASGSASIVKWDDVADGGAK